MTTTTTIAKTPVVTVADKVVTKAKPAAKAAPKAKAKAAPKAKVAFVLVDRPVSGNRLYAFTQAVLELTGLEKGAQVEKAQLRKIVGDTAIRYHLTKGTYAQDESGKIGMTAAGKASFAGRAGRIDSALVEAYKEVMTTGQPVASVCKNKDLIRAI